MPVKGIGYLIDAMPRVRAAFPECELVLLGARPGSGDFGRYRSAIDAAGIGADTRIVETRPHDELPDWMRASDVLVLPSVAEGFGLVAAEAMATGRPVVATRCGGPEEVAAVLIAPPELEAVSAGGGAGLAGPARGDIPGGEGPISFRDKVEQFEAEIIREALEGAHWNVSEAAKKLQTDRANLHRKMKRLGIERPDG